MSRIARGESSARMAGLAALLLAGCATQEKPLTEPAPGVPEAYAERPAGDATAETAWTDFILDPALKGLVARALEGNRDLRLAVLRVREARAAAGIQQADRLPTLAAGAAALRAGVPSDLSGQGRPFTGDQFGLSIGFTSWEIDLWGRIQELNEAAMQSYLQTEAAQRAVRVSLVSQVADCYLSLREADERLALAKLSAASRADTLRIFRRRLELGATSRLEVTQVELLLQQAETLVTRLEQARATQAHALDVLIGSPADVTRDGLRLGERPVFRAVDPGLPSSLLTRRPDVIAAEHGLRAARANIAAARAAFLPRITLTAEAGLASAELGSLVGGDSRAWSFAPSISVPIFDGGRLRASLDVAEIRREQAVARYELAVQSAFRDVADALTAGRWLAEQTKSLDATERTLKERTRLAKLRYDSGAARYLEVLDAERDLLAVGQERVQNRRALLSARMALFAALGGGVTAPSAQR